MKKNFDYRLRVISLGKSEIGKTNFNTRLTSNDYKNFKDISKCILPTIGIDYIEYNTEIKNKKFKIKLIDTTSQERFSGIVRRQFKFGQIFLIFYDSFDRKSFEKAKSYIYEIQEENRNPILILIRNKYDLNLESTRNENFVTDEEALEFADEHNIMFFHISNFEKYETGIKELLSLTIKEYLKRKEIEEKEDLYTYEKKRCKVKKPIIYLYPEKPMDITIQVNIKENNKFIVVYPKFNKENNTWNVYAKPNGEIIINDKTYPYLFWEAQSYLKVEINEGFIVKDEDAENFLEEKLKIFGLNDKESTDFITFWLPILLDNKLSVCTFQTKEYYENFELNIEPKPETLIRIFLFIKIIKTPFNIKEQKLEKIERKGYTVVEWGGCNC